jgi:hypothetical protein
VTLHVNVSVAGVPPAIVRGLPLVRFALPAASARRRAPGSSGRHGDRAGGGGQRWSASSVSSDPLRGPADPAGVHAVGQERRPRKTVDASGRPARSGALVRRARVCNAGRRSGGRCRTVGRASVACRQPRLFCPHHSAAFPTADSAAVKSIIGDYPRCIMWGGGTRRAGRHRWFVRIPSISTPSPSSLAAILREASPRG